MHFDVALSQFNRTKMIKLDKSEKKLVGIIQTASVKKSNSLKSDIYLLYAQWLKSFKCIVWS